MMIREDVGISETTEGEKTERCGLGNKGGKKIEMREA